MKVLLLMLLPVFVNAQNLEIKGSYSIAAICNDGIVISADSRGGFEDNETGALLGYCDTIQKVFDCKTFALSFTGYGFLKGKQLRYFINLFLQSRYYNTISDPSSIISNLLLFMKESQSMYYEPFLKNDIMAVGYYLGYPFLCRFHYPTRQDCTGPPSTQLTSGYLTTDKLCGFDAVYSPIYSCLQMKDIIANTINAYAEKANKKTEIGGKIIALRISKDNKFNWLSFYETKGNYDDLIDIVKSYYDKRFKINFLSQESEKRFYKITHTTLKK